MSFQSYIQYIYNSIIIIELYLFNNKKKKKKKNLGEKIQ